MSRKREFEYWEDPLYQDIKEQSTMSTEKPEKINWHPSANQITPSRNRVMVELIDNTPVVYIECCDMLKLPKLQEMARALVDQYNNKQKYVMTELAQTVGV